MPLQWYELACDARSYHCRGIPCGCLVNPYVNDIVPCGCPVNPYVNDIVPCGCPVNPYVNGLVPCGCPVNPYVNGLVPCGCPGGSAVDQSIRSPVVSSPLAAASMCSACNFSNVQVIVRSRSQAAS